MPMPKYARPVISGAQPYVRVNTEVMVVKNRNSRPKRKDMYSEQRRTIGWLASILRGRVMPLSKIALGVSAAAGLLALITFCSSGRWSSFLRRSVLWFKMTT